MILFNNCVFLGSEIEILKRKLDCLTVETELNKAGDNTNIKSSNNEVKSASNTIINYYRKSPKFEFKIYSLIRKFNFNTDRHIQ